MSSIEERLMRDIAAVTGGISMTNTDLGDARASLDDRIESSRRTRRRGLVAAAAVVAVLAGGITAFQVTGDGPDVVGPASPGTGAPAPDPATEAFLKGGPATAQVLVGVWRVDNGTVAVQFRENGTMAYDDDGTLFGKPDVIGTWTSDGDLIRIVTTASERAECVGAQVRLWASNPETGRVRAVLDAGDRVECSPVGRGPQTLEKLLPATIGTFAAEFSALPGWRTLTEGSLLDGVFFSTEDLLLELVPDSVGSNGEAAGRYYVAAGADSIADQGTWRSTQGALILTSSAKSTECQAGDRLEFRNVEYLSGGTLGFRGEVTANACGGAWGALTWIRVPDGPNPAS